MSEKKAPKLIGRECKFAVHMPARDSDQDDLHYVKERLHYDDGTTKPNVKLIANYQRPYWITKQSARNHNDKKEWEHIDNLNEFKCTQSQLRDHVARRIEPLHPRGTFRMNGPVRQYGTSQYLYGTDISSTTWIKKQLYRDRWPECLTAETLAVLDIETNMIEKNEEPIMATTIFQDTVKIAILRKMVAGYSNPQERLDAAVKKYVHDFVKMRNLASRTMEFLESSPEKDFKKKRLTIQEILKIGEIREEAIKHDNPIEWTNEKIRQLLTSIDPNRDVDELLYDKDDIVEIHELKVDAVFVDTQKELFTHCLSYLHETQPDFLAIWNMDFDIPRILEALKKEGVDPAEIFCDPQIPEDRRVFKYKQDNPKRKTASGVVKSKSPSDQWHTLFCTAPFYVIDAMCAYRYLRLGNQEESSYALDAILAKILKGKVQKLKFEEAEGYSAGAWHEFMQRNYIFEYAAYNIFDCLCMIFLDEKTKDLRLTFHTSSYISDFENFKSLPKRITDALFFDIIKDGWILGDAGSKPKDTEPEESEEEDDSENDDPYAIYGDQTLDLKNWILTLPAHLQQMGLAMIEENPHILTGIRGLVYDSDAVSAYPSCISTANVSKETTKRELIAIVGKEEKLFRMQNLNLVLGGVNAIEYSSKMFDMPQAFDLLEDLKSMGM